MARKSNPGGRIEDLRHVLIVVGLVSGIVGTLALGAVLRVDPAAAAVTAPPAAPPAFVPALDPAPPDPELVQQERIEELGQPDALEDLVASDAEAFDPPGAFTLQFMVACKPEVVARVGQALAGDAALRVTPVEVAGQPCQRIAWGRFEDPASARRAIRDAPPALLALTAEPLVKRLDEPRE